MGKNINFTQLDTNQVINRKFDPDNDADRVILVGGEKVEISIDQDKMVQAIKDGLSNIKIDNNQPVQQATQIQVIEKNVFIPQIEIREIEKQVIVPQIEYRTIEIPVVTERVVTVDRPVIIKETEFKEIVKERHYPLIITICNIVQAMGVATLLILNLLKK